MKRAHGELYCTRPTSIAEVIWWRKLLQEQGLYIAASVKKCAKSEPEFQFGTQTNSRRTEIEDFPSSSSIKSKRSFAQRGQFQDHGNDFARLPALSVFQHSAKKMLQTKMPQASHSSSRKLRRKLLFAGVVLLATSCALLANTSGRLRAGRASDCYCHCAKSRGISDCVKMCELPKYADRWWANTCARSHARPNGEQPDAGPRLHHPNHAEHARL